MYRSDDRAQSIQIGAVILFGALILALSSYQAFVVPQQNEGVEVSHSQQVQNELGDLRNAVVSVPGDPASQSVSITLGTRYPDRIVAMNPGPASGSLRTQGTADGAVSIGIDNATAAGETGDVWNGTERTYSTGAVAYRPNYNEYGAAPTTIYENSVLFNAFESGPVALSGQTLVDGRTVSLVALNGSLSETGSESTAVDVRPTGASTTTVSVENASADEPVTIRAPTRLDESTWDGLFRSENVSEGGFVRNATVVDRPSSSTFDTLRLTLKPNETYDLRLAKAGLGSGVGDEDERYLTDVAGNGTSVPEEGTTRLAVQVRDEYNNPVSGVTVTGDTGLGTLVDRTATTDEDGRATFTFEAPTVTGERVATVNLSYAADPQATPSFDRDRPENVRVDVRVQNTQVDGSGEGNAGAPYTLEWANPAVPNFTYDVGRHGDTRDLDAELVTEEIGLDNGSVDGATVDFAVNNRSVADISPSSDATDVDGIATTTMTAKANGTVRIYAVSGGASDVVNVTLTNVSAGDPIADFSYAPAEPTTADTVQFTDQSTDGGTIVLREWDVDGDGNVEYTGQSPTHDYASPGSYDVVLNVTDDDGNYDTVTKTVQVTVQSSAEQVTYVSGSGGTFWDNDGVSFDVDNGGSSSVTVTGVTINGTSESQVAQVAESQSGSHAEGQHEVYVDASTDGALDVDGTPYWEDDGAPLALGEFETMTEDAVLDAGTTASVDVYQFQNGGGGSSVVMSGETVTVTLHFADGSNATFQVSA